MESNARMDSPESTESKIAAGESEPTNEGEVDSKEEMLSQNIGSNNVDEEVGQDTSRTTTASSSIHGDKPMKTSWWSRYCRMYSLPILSLISFVLVGTVLYVAYQFIAKKNNKPIKSNSDKIKGGKIRQQQYIDNIISTIVYDKTTLLNASSSQYKAHEWMLNHDNYDWTANEQEGTIRMDSHIHQRYSLAVLYFATTTPNPNVTNSLSGTNYSNWMNGQHECSRKDGGFWAGLNCNADDQVQTLWFGTNSRGIDVSA